MARERKFSMELLFRHTKELLLLHGYDAFNFSMLADQLNVVRGTIYKYFENKDELISAFMIEEMKQSHEELQKIEQYGTFDEQFQYLMNFMFQNENLNKLIEIGMQIPNSTAKVKKNKSILTQLRLDMYKHLQHLIVLGKKEKKLKPHIPDSVILGFIFQSIAIPNHFALPKDVWVSSIKELLCSGMFEKA